MRAKRARLSVVTATFAASLLGSGFTNPLGAATLTWDADNATAGVQDGDGFWNTGNNNWHDGAGNVAWANSNDAVFGGTSGTPGLVKIDTAAISPSSMTFNVDGYTIEDTSSSIRLNLASNTGGITANGDTTIRTFRGAIMLRATQTFTVAPGKTLTMDNTPEANSILVGGNIAGNNLTLDGGGTVEFISSDEDFALGVPAATILFINNATATVTGRTSGALPDGASLVVRSRSNFSGDAGKVFVNAGGLLDLGTTTLVVQQNQVLDPDGLAVPTGPPGELHLDGGAMAVGAIGSAAIASSGVIYINGGEIRATMDNDNFIPAPWVAGPGGQGPQAMYVGANGATIDTDGFNVTSYNPLLENPASTGGAFVKTGAGIFTTAGDNTYTGGTTIEAGTLELGAGGTSGSILGDVVNDGTLAFNRSDVVTFAGLISGTGGVLHNGLGTTYLTAANTYTGASVSDAGLLAFEDAAAYGTTPSITANGFGSVGLDTSSLDAAFIAKIQAAPTPSDGGLALASVDAASDVDFTAVPLNHANTRGMSVGAIGSVNYTGTITPDATLGYRVGGGGTLTLANANALTGARPVTVTNGGTVVLPVANDYTGLTTIEGPTTLAVAGSSSLGDGSATNGLAFDGGTLRTDGPVASAFRDAALGAGGGTVDTNGFDSSLGNVAGTGPFTKNGLGNLTVNHVRSSALSVNDGKLTIVPSGGAAGGVS